MCGSLTVCGIRSAGRTLSQLAKTVLAAVVAWVLAVHVFHLSQAFMAPWAALLTVQATVFGTVRGGTQQAAASVLGVLIAFGAWSLLGLNFVLAWAGGPGRPDCRPGVPGVRAETTTAATAVVVLTTGDPNNGDMLVARLEDTGIGIATGLPATCSSGRRCATVVPLGRST